MKTWILLGTGIAIVAWGCSSDPTTTGGSETTRGSGSSGGHTQGSGGDSGGGDAGTGGAGTGASTSTGGAGGAGAGGGGGAGGAGNVDCTALGEDVDTKLTAAQTCSLIAPGNGDCKHSEPGKCCAVLVTQPDSNETHAYLDALAAFQDAGCVTPCPDSPCNPDPHGACDGGPNLSSGTCVMK